MFNGIDYSMSLNMSMAFFHLFRGIPAARSRVACPAVGQAKADLSRHSAEHDGGSSGLLKAEGQADLSAVGPAKVECQHANAPPQQVPGREVAGFQLAPRLPFATWNPPPSPPGS
jgi:hypothetical protein